MRPIIPLPLLLGTHPNQLVNKTTTVKIAAGTNKIIVMEMSQHSHHLLTSTLNQTVEDAFPVMEADKEEKCPKNAGTTMLNKKRLTPLSIMVCDTISALRSRTLLNVLFDPGSTAEIEKS